MGVALIDWGGVALAWGPKEQYSSDMLHAQLFHHVRREDTRSKGSPEDVGKLLVQPSNAHLVEIPVRTDQHLMCRVPNMAANQLDDGILQRNQS